MGNVIANIMQDWNDGAITTDMAASLFGNLLDENRGRACVVTWTNAIRELDPYHSTIDKMMPFMNAVTTEHLDALDLTEDEMWRAVGTFVDYCESGEIETGAEE